MYNPQKKKSYFLTIEQQKKTEAIKLEQDSFVYDGKIRSLRFRISELKYSCQNVIVEAKNEDRKSTDLERQASGKRSEANRLQMQARFDERSAQLVQLLLREAENLHQGANRANAAASSLQSRRNSIELDIRFVERDISLQERLKSDVDYKIKQLRKEAEEMHNASRKALD